MRALYLIEFVVFASFVYGVVTQIAMPLWRDTPLFPFFYREGKLESDLKDAKQGVLEAELEREINRQHKEQKLVQNETEKGRN
jgi:hypothetical protein